VTPGNHTQGHSGQVRQKQTVGTLLHTVFLIFCYSLKRLPLRKIWKKAIKPACDTIITRDRLKYKTAGADSSSFCVNRTGTKGRSPIKNGEQRKKFTKSLAKTRRGEYDKNHHFIGGYYYVFFS